jgi:hypothetical protein
MQFVCAPTLSPNADADLLCRETRKRIGSRQSGSYSSRLIAVELRTLLADSVEKALVDLAQALRERLAVIRDEQSRRDEEKHIARLRVVSEKIDKLQATLPQPVDPRLAHYLQRRSYDKALQYLEAAPSREGT